jgi:hypothetical protein
VIREITVGWGDIYACSRGVNACMQFACTARTYLPGPESGQIAGRGFFFICPRSPIYWIHFDKCATHISKQFRIEMCVCTLLKANPMGERVRAYALKDQINLPQIACYPRRSARRSALQPPQPSCIKCGAATTTEQTLQSQLFVALPCSIFFFRELEGFAPLQNFIKG